MKGRLIKSLGMLWLSVLFAYSGVAWAFEDCFKGTEDSVNEQVPTGNSQSNNSSVDLPAASDGDRASEVHCLTIHHEFDAIVQSSSASFLTQPRKAIQLKSSFSSRGLALVGEDMTGGRSPHLDSFITSSPPGFPLRSRYLLLSVFLI
jgi:hypothetical protein